MKRVITKAGTVFGDWTTQTDCYRVGITTYAMCKCVCGTERAVPISNLKGRKTLGCGCKHGVRISKSKTRHGLSEAPEHITWMNMRRRCNDPSDKAFKNYGQRGIFVCERWEKSFDTFIGDMGMRPTARHSIERINNDGPYSPENCKWASQSEQANNKRNNIRVVHKGIERTLASLANEHGINAKTLYTRFRSGLPLLQKAPLGPRGPRRAKQP